MRYLNTILNKNTDFTQFNAEISQTKEQMLNEVNGTRAHHKLLNLYQLG